VELGEGVIALLQITSAKPAAKKDRFGIRKPQDSDVSSLGAMLAAR